MRAKVLCFMASFLLLLATSSLAASYTVTVAANSGGIISPQKGKITVQGGDALTVGFTALGGYYLASVKVDKQSINLTSYGDNNTCSYPFTNVQANHSIAATFAKDPIITASSNAGGVVSPSSGPVPVEYGTNKTFDITTTKDGYHIAKVLVDGKTPIDFPTVTTTTPTSYSYTFSSVVAKHTLKAQFAINTYAVTTTPSGGGKITPASLPAVKYGQIKTFTVTPSKWMKIASVTVNGEPRTGFTSAPSKPYPLKETIIKDTTIVATFIPTGVGRLNGTYNLVHTEYGFWQSSSSGSTYVNSEFNGKNISAVFDGKGNASVKLEGFNFNPATDSSNNQIVNSSPKSETYSNCKYSVIDTDGSFTITRSGKTLVTGWVSSDNNSVVIGDIGTTTETGGTGYEIRQVAGVKAGTSVTPSSMSGTYHLFNQMTGFFKSTNGASTTVTEYMHGGLNTVIFDGTGTCTLNYSGYELDRNMLGTGGVTMNSETHNPSCSYTVDSNGVFTLTTTKEGDSTTETITGWGSADGNVAIVGNHSVTTKTGGIDYEIEKVIGVKAGENNMSVASVSGTFRLVDVNASFLADETGGGPDRFQGNNITAVFDGSGGCSVSVSGAKYSGNNGKGTVTVVNDTPTVSACSYTVDSYGAFTLNITMDGKDESVAGWASADGMAMVIGASGMKTGSEGDNYFTKLLYGVKTLPL
jgi:hypothetical protein